jgi:hypothetical protein
MSITYKCHTDARRELERLAVAEDVITKQFEAASWAINAASTLAESRAVKSLAAARDILQDCGFRVIKSWRNNSRLVISTDAKFKQHSNGTVTGRFTYLFEPTAGALVLLGAARVTPQSESDQDVISAARIEPSLKALKK